VGSEEDIAFYIIKKFDVFNEHLHTFIEYFYFQTS
jgi:hypothetical protein